MEPEVLQEIPGYRAILKSVLKAQIQLLMEQLANQAGEESIILTASIQDGSLSHLGSSTGKGFLEGRDEIKAQFLGYCLKNQHGGQESEPVPYQKSRTLLPPSRRPRPRIRPSPYGIPSPGNSPPQFGLPNLGSPYHMSPAAAHSQSLAGVGGGHANAIRAPLNPDNTVDNFLDAVSGKDASGLGLDGSSSSQVYMDAAGLGEEAGDGLLKEEGTLEEGSDKQDQEGLAEGPDSASADDWHNNTDGKNTNDQNVKLEKDDGNLDDAASRHLGGIAFPGLDNAHHDFNKSLADMSPAELKHALYPQGVAQPSNGLDLSSVNTREAFDLTPRRRGRPRKSPEVPDTPSRTDGLDLSMSEANKGGNGLDNMYGTPDPFLMRKRGRPKKEFENLPPGVVSPAGISIGNGYVKCNICAKILKATSMFTHKQSHLGIRNYSCGYCGKSFTQKGPLITHERVHTGEKPYNCNQCGKAFSAHSGLYQHRRRCTAGVLSQVPVAR